MTDTDSPAPASSLDLSANPVPRSDLAFVELDGEGVVFDEENGRLHRLDGISTTIWTCLDGSGPLHELVADLAEAYQADAEQVAADVLTLVRRLDEEGLLASGDVDQRAADAPAVTSEDTPVLPDPPST